MNKGELLCVNCIYIVAECEFSYPGYATHPIIVVSLFCSSPHDRGVQPPSVEWRVSKASEILLGESLIQAT